MSVLSDQLLTDAAKAAATSNDGVSVSKRSLTELIEADKYLRSITAAASPAAAFRLLNSKIVPPGGV